jgi:hypothetical protein
VATDAILLEQDGECHFLLWRHVLVSGLRLAREVATDQQADEQRYQSTASADALSYEAKW